MRTKILLLSSEWWSGWLSCSWKKIQIADSWVPTPHSRQLAVRSYNLRSSLSTLIFLSRYILSYETSCKNKNKEHVRMENSSLTFGSPAPKTCERKTYLTCFNLWCCAQRRWTFELLTSSNWTSELFFESP